MLLADGVSRAPRIALRALDAFSLGKDCSSVAAWRLPDARAASDASTRARSRVRACRFACSSRRLASACATCSVESSDTVVSSIRAPRILGVPRGDDCGIGPSGSSSDITSRLPDARAASDASTRARSRASVCRLACSSRRLASAYAASVAVGSVLLADGVSRAPRILGDARDAGDNGGGAGSSDSSSDITSRLPDARAASDASTRARSNVSACRFACSSRRLASAYAASIAVGSVLLADGVSRAPRIALRAPDTPCSSVAAWRLPDARAASDASTRARSSSVVCRCSCSSSRVDDVFVATTL